MSCVISAQVVRARDGLGFEQYLVGEAFDDVLTVGRAMDGLVLRAVFGRLGHGGGKRLFD